MHDNINFSDGIMNSPPDVGSLGRPENSLNETCLDFFEYFWLNHECLPAETFLSIGVDTT